MIGSRFGSRSRIIWGDGSRTYHSGWIRNIASPEAFFSLGKDKFCLSPRLIVYLEQDTENYQGFKTRITVKTKLLSKYRFISVAKEVKCNLEAGPTQIDLQLR